MLGWFGDNWDKLFSVATAIVAALGGAVWYVEDRLDRLQGRIDNLAGTIQHSEDQLEELERQVGSTLSAQLEDFDNRLDGLEKQAATKGDMQALDGRFVRLDVFEERGMRISNLSGSVNALDQRLYALATKVTVASGRMIDLESDKVRDRFSPFRQ